MARTSPVAASFSPPLKSGAEEEVNHVTGRVCVCAWERV